MWLRDAFAHPSSTVLPSMTSCHKVGHGWFFSLYWRPINPLFCFKTYLPKKKKKPPKHNTHSGRHSTMAAPSGPVLGQLPPTAPQMHPGCSSASGSCSTGRAGKEHCWPPRSSIGRTGNSIACPPPSRSFTLSGGTGLVKSDSEPVKLCPLANRVCACPTAYSHLHDTLRWKEPL